AAGEHTRPGGNLSRIHGHDQYWRTAFRRDSQDPLPDLTEEDACSVPADAEHEPRCGTQRGWESTGDRDAFQQARHPGEALHARVEDDGLTVRGEGGVAKEISSVGDEHFTGRI